MLITILYAYIIGITSFGSGESVWGDFLQERPLFPRAPLFPRIAWGKAQIRDRFSPPPSPHATPDPAMVSRGIT